MQDRQPKFSNEVAIAKNFRTVWRTRNCRRYSNPRICNARYASEALKKDVNIALMLPCPIAVYAKEGKTFISTMLPSAALLEFYPDAGIETIASDVETVVLQVVKEAK